MLPRRNDAVNDTWMCDHGRLRYRFAHDETRLRHAAVRGVHARRDAGARAGRQRRRHRRGLATTMTPHRRRGERIAPRSPRTVPVAVLGSPHDQRGGFRASSSWCRRSVRRTSTVVLVGPSDDLIKPEKAANARGARAAGIAPARAARRAILDACASGELRPAGGRQPRRRAGGITDAVALDALIVVDAIARRRRMSRWSPASGPRRRQLDQSRRSRAAHPQRRSAKVCCRKGALPAAGSAHRARLGGRKSPDPAATLRDRAGGAVVRGDRLRHVRQLRSRAAGAEPGRGTGCGPAQA